MDIQQWMEWWGSLEWQKLIPELIGKTLGFLLGFIASWYLVFRRKLNAFAKLQAGDSDDFIFQMHRLVPHSDIVADATESIEERFVLLFRNISPKTTLNDLYDNVAVREETKRLAEQTTLNDPILHTEGTIGFEILNDAFGHIAGSYAISPFHREKWLFAMTCEDRQAVRKKCIRCFLIRPAELEKFRDWSWCTTNVLVERPWHWFRVVALHRIAQVWDSECQELAVSERAADAGNRMPLVDKQSRHQRIRPVSLGLNLDEQPIGDPYKIPWDRHVDMLRQLGLETGEQEASTE